MPASKAQQKAVTKYVKSKYDRFGLTMQKGKLDTIKAYADGQGESTNAFINRAISEAMERDTSPQGDGTVSLPLDTLKAAQDASQAAGETLPVFMARAVEETADRDALRELDRKKGG